MSIKNNIALRRFDKTLRNKFKKFYVELNVMQQILQFIPDIVAQLKIEIIRLYLLKHDLLLVNSYNELNNTLQIGIGISTRNAGIYSITKEYPYDKINTLERFGCQCIIDFIDKKMS